MLMLTDNFLQTLQTSLGPADLSCLSGRFLAWISSKLDQTLRCKPNVCLATVRVWSRARDCRIHAGLAEWNRGIREPVFHLHQHQSYESTQINTAVIALEGHAGNFLQIYFIIKLCSKGTLSNSFIWKINILLYFTACDWSVRSWYLQ